MNIAKLVCPVTLGLALFGTGCNLDLPDPLYPWFADNDGDGYGVGDAVWASTAPPMHAPKGGDCDDTEALNFPGNYEVVDGIDNDCDSVIDEAVVLADFAGSYRVATTTSFNNWEAILDIDALGNVSGSFRVLTGAVAVGHALTGNLTADGNFSAATTDPNICVDLTGTIGPGDPGPSYPSIVVTGSWVSCSQINDLSELSDDFTGTRI